MFWRYFKALRAAFLFSCFYLSGTLFGLVLLPIISLASFITPGKTRRIRNNQRLVGAGFQCVITALRWLRLIDVDRSNIALEEGSGPYVIVANHPTTIDVVAMLSVFRTSCVVVKHKIWHNFFLRPLFVWCGHIYGGDGSFTSSKLVLAQIEERLRQGFSVVVFPEGTRSPAGGLATMMKGAFAVASTTRVDVLPVVLRVSPIVLNREQSWATWPKEVVSYQMTTHDTIPCDNVSARLLHKKIETLFRNELGLGDGVGSVKGSPI